MATIQHKSVEVRDLISKYIFLIKLISECIEKLENQRWRKPVTDNYLDNSLKWFIYKNTGMVMNAFQPCMSINQLQDMGTEERVFEIMTYIRILKSYKEILERGLKNARKWLLTHQELTVFIENIILD